MTKNCIFCIIAICILWCIYGCREKVRSSEPEQKKTKIQRFDEELPLFMAGTISDSADFIKCYSDFMPLYCYGILNLSPDPDSDRPYNRNGISEFLSDTAIKRLYNDTEAAFRNINDIEAELTDASLQYLKLFPGDTIPRILTHISGLNQAIVISDSLLSISLDHYLGSSYPGYQGLFYSYQLPLKERSRIPTDVMQVLLYTRFPKGGDRNTLLGEMIYEGAIVYLLQQIFPQKTSGEIIGYNDDEIAWCKKNEPEIWDKILRQKHLFSTDLLIRSKYLEPAPFTAPVSPESPGRIGRWIGWRIVSEYMDRCGSCTPQELMMQRSNEEQILKISKYKGK